MPVTGVPSARDTSIRNYQSRRDFARTPEPAARKAARQQDAPIFVVQKHDARRLHWDFRLEHGGVLWSWAVPRGPSLDPHDKRLAVRTEDHPLDYAVFSGTIPEGQYGAGTVEIWDRGHWSPRAEDAAAALEKGELKFVLEGERLRGAFVLVRMKPRPKDRAENWLLIKEHDDQERAGIDAAALEQEVPSIPQKPPKAARGKPAKPFRASSQVAEPPAAGAVRGKLPNSQAPQLATPVAAAPDGAEWLSEMKFDGYRILAFKDGDEVRLLTRNAKDWTARLPTLAAAIGKLKPRALLLDCEMVALREDGVPSFALLQQALSDGKDRALVLYAFDLLHLDGWDLRPCRLDTRKAVLAELGAWKGPLRYSDHMQGRAGAMRREACAMGLEGIVSKRADAPYTAGRGRAWVKVKCQGREEFAVIGFTPPAGSRTGIGSLHMGYRDPEGAWQYAGGVGTGFTEKELAALRRKLDPLKSGPPAGLLYADEPPARDIVWVKPVLVAEVQFAGWSGSGRLRHAAYLGLREDKAAQDVRLPAADPEAARQAFSGATVSRSIVRASAPARASKSGAKPKAAAKPEAASRIARASAPASAAARASAVVGGMRISHADRELWPGITKRDLAEYWSAVANHALPEIAHRPLALVRCPEGIAGERFFQKHARAGFPKEIRAGESGKAPYLVLDGVDGLLACAQVSAIELHAWGSREDDPAHPDRLVFDLDPGDDITFADVVGAAHDVRKRLEESGLESFCRTTGGKGLHVVVPLVPGPDWDAVRPWCRAFAERMAEEEPGRYVSRLSKSERRGKILVDWLRNGLGSTAVASFSPRARPGATVATPVAWGEVTKTLDPSGFTVGTMPKRLAKLNADPWSGFTAARQSLPAGPMKGKG